MFKRDRKASRKINGIIIHCTASRKNATIFQLCRDWAVRLGWRSAPGYHKLVFEDGETVRLEEDNAVVNGAKGYNADHLHISWVGGHTRCDITKEQKIAVYKEVLKWQAIYELQDWQVKGHNEVSNKECPRFNVHDFLNEMREMGVC